MPQILDQIVEIWGGVECTVVRIRDRIHDQLKNTGHEKRPDDLRLFKELGIRTIRYPLLWEKFADDRDAFIRLHDSRLKQACRLEITPIAGLLHHGSGPAFTNPNNNDFPELLAEYAYTIARRYPWIMYYTPVNEPLTTARFSGLYGIWYPHLNDNYSFHRIFLNEMKGIVLSMQAIRTVNPNAQLIQTEDLCKVHSTEFLKYQADFENIRRWLTYDILTCKFTSTHPLWSFFAESGINEKDLDFFQKNKCEPAVCGFNYYISSERYLDHNTSAYPVSTHGGNGIHKYADVEAVRVSGVQVNLYDLLKEAWKRYRLPMALTEVHMACTREEQLRWFHEIRQIAEKIKHEHIDFKAITVWSFLGSYDWNSLMKQGKLDYESGPFDIRSGTPRPTALATYVKKLNNKEDYHNKLLDVPGWWHRDIRKLYGNNLTVGDNAVYENSPPLLILGATGSLGNAFAKICHTRGLIYQIIDRTQLEITSRINIEKNITEKKPWAIINTIGYTDIEKAEQEPGDCFRVNTLGPAILAEMCKSFKIKLVTFSTDQVFNGKKRKPYLECDWPEPLNVYGESKRKAEEAVLKLNSDSLIIRSSSFYNPWHQNDLLTQLLSIDHNLNGRYYFPSDIILSPTYIPDLVNTTLDLLIDNENGIWHLSNDEEITSFEFIKKAFDMAGISGKNLVGIPYEKLKYSAEKPHYSVLSNSKGVSLAPLSKALENYLKELTLVAR
ncbi:MAG TPA: sugar nucleotide-binding protein [Bacteroidales bacterium]|nr:sugar nucleotide-binding protein [Bacteroidales bacterium]